MTSIDHHTRALLKLVLDRPVVTTGEAPHDRIYLVPVVRLVLAVDTHRCRLSTYTDIVPCEQSAASWSARDWQHQVASDS